MSTYTFVLNPMAGKGRAGHLKDHLQSLIDASGIIGQIHITRYAGHATEIARSSDSHYICAVGGDGTVNECVNGIIGSSKILGVLPAGSGNDLIKSLQLPGLFEPAFSLMLQNNIRTIDCGKVVCENTSRHFINGVGIGFDAAVANRTRSISYLSGTALYLVAVMQTLGKYKAPNFQLQWDSVSVKSSNLLIAIGNGRCAGGGFYLTPDAKVDDGLFDICAIRDIPVHRILFIMPKVMKGIHTRQQEVSMFRTGSQIRVSGDRAFYVHADGEIVGENVTAVEIRPIPKAIRVLTG